MKKSYTATFKAQVVLELLKETKTISQLASEYGVHPNVLREWRQAAIKGLPDLFENRDSLTEARAAYERQIEVLGQALCIATPEIWNTDQGSQFTSPQLITHLEAAGVAISMDVKGHPHDNIFTERLWRSLKYEEIYLADYGSPREARVGIGSYFQFYNSERPHQALDYRRPADLYLG
jgi:putative transposase